MGSSQSSEEKFDKWKNLRKFHLFPRLPTELRFYIWSLALKEPRIVDVMALNRGRPVYNSFTGQGQNLKDRQYVCFYQSRIALLSVCQESRVMVLYGKDCNRKHAISIERDRPGTLWLNMWRLGVDARLDWFKRSRTLAKSISFEDYKHTVPSMKRLHMKFDTETDVFLINERSWSPSTVRYPLQLFDNSFTRDILSKIKYLAVIAGSDTFILDLLQYREFPNMRIVFVLNHHHGRYEDDGTKVPLGLFQRANLAASFWTQVRDLQWRRKQRGWERPKVKFAYSRSDMEYLSRKDQKLEESYPRFR